MVDISITLYIGFQTTGIIYQLSKVEIHCLFLITSYIYNGLNHSFTYLESQIYFFNNLEKLKGKCVFVCLPTVFFISL